ncbi:hypothetical protein LG651_04725 [Tamlana sp. 62-3]|uniref:Uncharacterized protein n=1 Tax=Neotamlana sargassicola TaxID=2883125 RepID=A0A9X1L6G0_9FLAO|nr:hypothetical protein [Tamlana sargassicola]MCB4807544.1 hypothetical protein [Tamlana sargassicola]
MEFKNILIEFKALSNNGLYTRGKIDWWLLKEEKRYQNYLKMINILTSEFPGMPITEHISLKNEVKFIHLYDKLSEVAEMYRFNNNPKLLINLDKIISSINFN